MIKQVKYTTAVQAIAMSKWPSQAGLQITDEGDKITLNSINRKDGKVTSYLQLQIPKENLQEVINVLKDSL